MLSLIYAFFSFFAFLLVWTQWKSCWFHACEYNIDAGVCYKVLLVGRWLLEYNGHRTWSRFTLILLFFPKSCLLFILLAKILNKPPNYPKFPKKPLSFYCSQIGSHSMIFTQINPYVDEKMSRDTNDLYGRGLMMS